MWKTQLRIVWFLILAGATLAGSQSKDSTLPVCPQAYVLALDGGDIALLDCHSWRIHTARIETGWKLSYQGMHVFDEVGKILCLAHGGPNDDYLLVLIDLTRGTARVLQRDFVHVLQARVSRRNPNAVYIEHSIYDRLSLEMLKAKYPRQGERHDRLELFDVATETWRDAEADKPDFKQASVPFRSGTPVYEEFIFREWDIAPPEIRAAWSDARLYADDQYGVLQEALVDAGLINPRRRNGKWDRSPILYWGEHFQLCRSAGELILVSGRGRDGQSVLAGRVSAKDIRQSPRLLTPQGVACITDGSMVDRFVRAINGRETFSFRVPAKLPPKPDINDPALWRWRAIRIDLNTWQRVYVSNFSDKAIPGLRLECRPEDQPGGRLPAGLEIMFDDGVDTLPPEATVELHFILWGAETAPPEGDLILRLIDDRPDGSSRKIHYFFHCGQLESTAPAFRGERGYMLILGMFAATTPSVCS